MRAIETSGGYLLRLERGARLPDALVEFCEKKNIRAATVEGIGALADVALGYYRLESREYERIELPGSFELLSLFADVASFEDGLFAHTHVVLSGADCIARGGHLFEGTVSVTAELRVWTIDRPVRRRMDDDLRLHLLDLPEVE